MAPQVQHKTGAGIGGRALSGDEVHTGQRTVRGEEQRTTLPGAMENDAEIIPGNLIYPLHPRASKGSGKLINDL